MNIIHRLVCLNTWFPDQGAAGEVVEPLRDGPTRKKWVVPGGGWEEEGLDSYNLGQSSPKIFLLPESPRCKEAVTASSCHLRPNYHTFPNKTAGTLWSGAKVNLSSLKLLLSSIWYQKQGK